MEGGSSLNIADLADEFLMQHYTAITAVTVCSRFYSSFLAAFTRQFIFTSHLIRTAGLNSSDVGKYYGANCDEIFPAVDSCQVWPNLVKLQYGGNALYYIYYCI